MVAVILFVDGIPGFCSIITQFITAAMAPDTDTGQAYTYLGITDTVGLLISIAGIILMLLTGMAYSSYLLQLAPSEKYTTDAYRRFNYLFRIAVAASVIGVMLIIPFRIMPWSRAMAPVMVTLISVPMVFANAWRPKVTYTINNEVNRKIFIWPVIFLITLLLIFQLILAKGVEM